MAARPKKDGLTSFAKKEARGMDARGQHHVGLLLGTESRTDAALWLNVDLGIAVQS